MSYLGAVRSSMIAFQQAPTIFLLGISCCSDPAQLREQSTAPPSAEPMTAAATTAAATTAAAATSATPPASEPKPTLDKYCTEFRPRAVYAPAALPRGCSPLVSHRERSQEDLFSIAVDRAESETRKPMPVPVRSKTTLTPEEKSREEWWAIARRKESELLKATNLDAVLTADEKKKLNSLTEVREEGFYCCP